jgi:hypothetical protein
MTADEARGKFAAYAAPTVGAAEASRMADATLLGEAFLPLTEALGVSRPR